MKKLLADWNPFDQKHHCIDIFQDWKVLLETNCNSVSWNKESDEDPYHQLVWDVWMPPVRKAILYVVKFLNLKYQELPLSSW